MSMNVFGVIVAGRLLQADFVQANDTEFVTTVLDAEAINHVVVFLTGVQAFPDGTGGSVYIRWSQSVNESGNWHYLGFITNEKPSAIFRVAQTDAQTGGMFASNVFDTTHHGSAQIGINVEPLNAIAERLPAAGTQPGSQTTLIEFANKMLSSFVNRAQSCIVSLPRPDNAGQLAEFIPVAVVQDWFETFSRRMQQNPHFWKSLP